MTSLPPVNICWASCISSLSSLILVCLSNLYAVVCDLRPPLAALLQGAQLGGRAAQRASGDDFGTPPTAAEIYEAYDASLSFAVCTCSHASAFCLLFCCAGYPRCRSPSAMCSRLSALRLPGNYRTQIGSVRLGLWSVLRCRHQNDVLGGSVTAAQSVSKTSRLDKITF